MQTTTICASFLSRYIVRNCRRYIIRYTIGKIR